MARSLFRRLTGDDGEETGLTVYFEDLPIAARAGETVAAALLAAGIVHFRTTLVGGTARGPYCLTGVCFDCLLQIDGQANRQGCMTQVRDGMRIKAMSGPRPLEGGDSG